VGAIKPVYLVSGEDETKLGAWRARVRQRAEAEEGPGALEAFDAGSSSPGEVAAALGMLTFATGTRYLLVDGVESWRAGSLEPLERALANMPPDTVLVLIARGRASKRLAEAVARAGGEAHEYAAPKPWELPKWVTARAQEEGLRLDSEAAKTLVAAVGPRQQRLLREIEKLAITAHPRGELSADEVRRLAAGDTAPEAFDLADAIAAGDLTAAIRTAEALRRREDKPGRLLFPVVRRLREVHQATELLDAGLPEQKVAESLNAPPWAAKRIVAKARKADRASLEWALCVFAELEIELRGGREGSALDEDTAFSLALARAVAADAPG
jgi:DNA polymerase-3 subunit delta